MTNKNQTKTESKSLWHRKSFRVFAIIIAAIMALTVVLMVFTWLWNANYHKDDLRDRPVNSNFVYIGRDFRGRNVSWFYNISGLRGLLGPSTETLYYTTDVPSDDFATKVPGNLYLKKKTSIGCAGSLYYSPCIELDIRNDRGRGGTVFYTSRQALLKASKEVGFPLKSDEKKYYVGITASVMQYINPANVDPEVYKPLAGESQQPASN